VKIFIALAITLLIGTTIIPGCSKRTPEDIAIDKVCDAAPRGRIPQDKLVVKNNPKGEGLVVIWKGYNAAWLVQRDKVYAINGLAAGVTPGVEYTRELNIDDVN
jgi:hypothetical protein